MTPTWPNLPRTHEAQQLAARIIQITDESGILPREVSDDDYERRSQWRRQVLEACQQLLAHTEALIQRLSDLRAEVISAQLAVMRPPVMILNRTCATCGKELPVPTEIPESSPTKPG